MLACGTCANSCGPGLSGLGDTIDTRLRPRLRTATTAPGDASPIPPEIVERKKAMQKTVGAPYTVAGKLLSPIERDFQRLTLARDWPSLFAYLPAPLWGQYGILGKYSFTEQNGRRVFIPFTEEEIARFVYSPYYTVQPGHECTDEQRAMGVAALWKASQTHAAKFPATDWRSIWPIYPGWGYPGQRYGCEKYVPSTWVKIRKPVMIAVAVVAAVYLGPLVADKIAAISAGTGEAATGIVGAGTKTGAVVAKAGISTATGTASLFTQVQTSANSLLSYVNKARTIEAIANGELPPPPIGIAGSNFTDWALGVAKEEMKKELMETVSEKMADEMVKREEAKMRAEIEAMQRELVKLIPADTSMRPAEEVPAKVVDIMAREKANAEKLSSALTIAVPLGLAYFLL